MKNTIKVITSLITVVSFFPIYSMVALNGHIFERNNLEHVNPLLHMNRLTVWPLTGGHNISDDDQFFTQEGLSLKLAAIRFLEGSDGIKNKETLKTIRRSASEGIPITSKHIIGANTKKIAVIIRPYANSTSVFMLIENWLKYEWFVDRGKKDDLKAAIFQGERERKERLSCICGELQKNKVPKDLEHEFLSCLSEYNVSEERTALIEQAEQKCLSFLFCPIPQEI